MDVHAGIELPKVAGILVGGKGARLGAAKPLLRHPQGGTFLEHIVRVAEEVFEDVVLLGHIEGLPESVRQLPVLEDVQKDRGPLAGLFSLLEYASPGWACLLSCDLPFLQETLLRRLIRRSVGPVDAVTFSRDPDEKSYHACCALYHSRILDAVRLELAAERSLQAVLRRVQTVVLTPSQSDQHGLININTPYDLSRLYAQ